MRAPALFNHNSDNMSVGAGRTALVGRIRERELTTQYAPKTGHSHLVFLSFFKATNHLDIVFVFVVSALPKYCIHRLSVSILTNIHFPNEC